jgi:hypothetical protein
MRGAAGSRLRWLAWLGAGIAWLVLVVFSGLAGDAENGYERAGRFLGVVVMTLGVALLLRWLYTKAGGERVWSPWLLVIATLAAVVVARGAERAADDRADAEPPPEVNLARLVGEAPAGHRYVATPPAERRRMRRVMAFAESKGFFARDVIARDRLVATVVVVTSDVDMTEEEVRAGIEDASGVRSTSTTLGDERILVTSLPGRPRMMVRTDRRAVAMLFVYGQFPAWNLARAILAG